MRVKVNEGSARVSLACPFSDAARLVSTVISSSTVNVDTWVSRANVRGFTTAGIAGVVFLSAGCKQSSPFRWFRYSLQALFVMRPYEMTGSWWAQVNVRRTGGCSS